MAYRQGNNGSFAKSEVNSAWLSSEFGENYARKIFGNEIVDSLPKYVKGNRKGQLKGKVVWRKITKGGWISGFGVVSPGKTYAHGIWDAPYMQQATLLHGIDANDEDEASASLFPEQPVIEQSQDNMENHPVYQYCVSNGIDYYEISKDADSLMALLVEMQS